MNFVILSFEADSDFSMDFAPRHMKTRPTVKPTTSATVEVRGPAPEEGGGVNSGKSSLATAEMRRPDREPTQKKRPRVMRVFTFHFSLTL